MNSLYLLIPGAPRTKKNHGQIIRVKGNPRIMPSPQWRKWRDQAFYPLRQQWIKMKQNPIAYPANCAAVFYRDRLSGDAVGYYQGLADLLEEVGVVENDKWITSWNGSRLEKDNKQPRVEVTLSWEEKE